VTVSVALSDPTEVLVSAGGTPAESVTLDFTAADWDQPKTVTVTGQPDGVLDDDQPFRLWVTTLDGTDTNYNSVGLFYLYGTNVDTDVGVSEGTAAAPYALTNGVAWSGQVGPSSSSYYVVELAPGVPFGFNLRVISDTLSVTVDDDGVFTSGNLCSWGPLPRDNVATCAGTVPAAGRVYVRVTTTSAAGAGYLMYAGTAKTFTSTEVPMAIPDGSATGAASGVVVAGGPLVLSKVVVRLTIAHPNDGDLTIGLKRPDGYTLQLANWIGGTGDGFVDTVFDDAAATSIAFGTAPFTGSFAPIVALDYLAGNSSEGTWQLVVTDQTSGNAGSIVSWSMTIY
jgi:subtilisin-like proprotein convertase family protein